MGNMRFNHVPGTISPAMDPEMVLLGMSVLRQLNFSQQSGSYGDFWCMEAG
jgi:aspartyl protease family protein